MRESVVCLALSAAVLSGSSLSSAQSPIKWPSLSENISPVEELSVPTSDGQTAIAVVRTPPGQGPFPIAMLIHGGLESQPMEVLRAVLGRATGSRFVAAGYVTVVPTHRGRNENPQAPGVIADILAVLDHIRGLPATDPDSVALYGCSAGADLALDIAARRNVAAVAIEEPASLFFTGMFNAATDKAEAQFRDTDAIPLLVNPQRFYTDAMRARTREKIGEITSPVFLLEGDQSFLGVDHHRVANEILVPELVAEGLSVKRALYPGQFHCFGMGVTVFGVADDMQEAMSHSFEDIHAFFKTYLHTQPVDVDESLVEYVSAADTAE